MTKLVIKWALLAPVSLFMAIFARLLCPVLPLFANDEGYLPSGSGGSKRPLTP